MFIDPKNVNVYMFLGKTDMRKSIDGLSLMVKEMMNLDPFSENLFVFCNKRHTTLKILYWDKNGFCLWYKRLEKDKFVWPKNLTEVHEITDDELSWLLKGLDYRTAHKSLYFSHIF